MTILKSSGSEIPSASSDGPDSNGKVGILRSSSNSKIQRSDSHLHAQISKEVAAGIKDPEIAAETRISSISSCPLALTSSKLSHSKDKPGKLAEMSRPRLWLPDELREYLTRYDLSTEGSGDELVARYEAKLRELAVERAQTREVLVAQSQKETEHAAEVGRPIDRPASPRSAFSDSLPQQDSPFKRVIKSLLAFGPY